MIIANVFFTTQIDMADGKKSQVDINARDRMIMMVLIRWAMHFFQHSFFNFIKKNY